MQDFLRCFAQLADEVSDRIVLQRESAGPPRDSHRQAPQLPSQDPIPLRRRLPAHGGYVLSDLQEFFMELCQFITECEHLSLAGFTRFFVGKWLVEMKNVPH